MRASVPAPKAHADARRPCARPRTQSGNPCTPIGSQGPFQAGGRAPPIHRVTKSRQGEFIDLLGHIYIYIYLERVGRHVKPPDPTVLPQDDSSESPDHIGPKGKHVGPGPPHHDKGVLARPHRHAEAHPRYVNPARRKPCYQSCEAKRRSGPPGPAWVWPIKQSARMPQSRNGKQRKAGRVLYPRRPARQAKVASHAKPRAAHTTSHTHTPTWPPKGPCLGGFGTPKGPVPQGGAAPPLQHLGKLPESRKPGTPHIYGGPWAVSIFAVTPCDYV